MDNILFCGNSSKHFFNNIYKNIIIEEGESNINTFKDGEIKIQIDSSVRDKNVYLIQSITSTKTKTINDILIELFLFIRTLKRASATKVIVIIPYFGYCRQDRKILPRVPISASDIAGMLENAGADRIISVELHCGQIQGFFRNIPCDNLYSANVLADAFKKDYKKNNLIVVSPDAGGVSRAKQFKENLLLKHQIESSFAVIVKERNIEGSIDNMSLVGEVKNKDAVIIDDICDTGGTLLKAVNLLKKFGANNIYVCITHGVFSENAIEKIENNKEITYLYVTDTIYFNHSYLKKIKVITVSELISSTIDIFINGGSVSKLFSTN